MKLNSWIDNLRLRVRAAQVNRIDDFYDLAGAGNRHLFKELTTGLIRDSNGKSREHGACIEAFFELEYA